MTLVPCLGGCGGGGVCQRARLGCWYTILDTRSQRTPALSTDKPQRTWHACSLSRYSRASACTPPSVSWWRMRLTRRSRLGSCPPLKSPCEESGREATGKVRGRWAHNGPSPWPWPTSLTSGHHSSQPHTPAPSLLQSPSTPPSTPSFTPPSAPPSQTPKRGGVQGAAKPHPGRRAPRPPGRTAVSGL